MVFFVEYSPSSCLSFFSEIGSLESILSAGNGHCARANMTELLTGCRDDKANKIVNIYLQKVAKNPGQFVKFG
jgi:hypothetical protein